MNGMICIADYRNSLKESVRVRKFVENCDPKQAFSYQKHSIMAHYSLLYPRSSMTACYHYTYQKQNYHVVYNGHLFNASNLKKELQEMSYCFKTDDEAEIILYSYLAWQADCPNHMDGNFAFVIDDEHQLFAARDHLGIKPLYYTVDGSTIVISHEIKALLQYLGHAIVDQDGIRELLALGPSLTPGKTIYRHIYALRPAHFLHFDQSVKVQRYWQLKKQPFTDNFETAVAKVRSLLIESVKKQTQNLSDLSAMLSGGLDSTILTGLAVQDHPHMRTYSISYENQKQYFQSYAYQTTMDDDYIQDAVSHYQTQHENMIFKQHDLVNQLQNAMIARDMPGMADIDSSFLIFAQQIAKKNKFCLSGECADEIFGGYPWFYKSELYQLPYFPWMKDLDQKLALFHERVQSLDLKSFIIERYQHSLAEIDADTRIQKMLYLNSEWFMQTLLIRADTLSRYAGLEVLVPFASRKILEYVYNLPESFLFYQQEEKGILRKAFQDFLPQSIRHRKKNPFPKTHSPLYTNLIVEKLQKTLADPDNILFQFFTEAHLKKLIDSKGTSFTSPWYGQLMMGPQLLAYLYQMYLWSKIYQIELQI